VISTFFVGVTIVLISVPELLAEARKNLRLLDAVAAMAECTDKGGAVIDVREPGEAQP
jgi:hypothetical protein